MFFLAMRRFRLRSDWVQTEGVLDMERDQPGTFFLVTVADCLENGRHALRRQHPCGLDGK